VGIVERVVSLVISDLSGDGRLLLYPGADVAALRARVVARVHAAPNHAHVGRVLLDALADDAAVEEVFATEEDVVERLNHAYG
jgi:molybdopterin/thiamine biosynthesis adenylyltransferase